MGGGERKRGKLVNYVLNITVMTNSDANALVSSVAQLLRINLPPSILSLPLFLSTNHRLPS